MQFAVKCLQFHLTGFRILAELHCLVPHVVSRQVIVLYFYQLKNIKNSLIRVKKSNGCGNLSTGVETYLLPLKTLP